MRRPRREWILCWHLYWLSLSICTAAAFHLPGRTYLGNHGVVYSYSHPSFKTNIVLFLSATTKYTERDLDPPKPPGNPSSAADKPKSFRTGQQQRRQPKTRRPRFYWQSVENVEKELRDFWIHVGVTIPEPPINTTTTTTTNNNNNTITKKSNNQKAHPLCIPNETLLNYFGRHDLRAAIVAHGGREELSHALLLPNEFVTIMPGKWEEAVNTSHELQILIQNETHVDLTAEEPPSLLLSSAQSPSSVLPDKSRHRKWFHQEGRKPISYWTQQRIIEELYDYLDEYKDLYGRPSIWCPRPSELATNGRKDLAQAMGRFGGTRRIVELAGLVPFREWNYFEGQYELLLLLKEYLDEYHPTAEKDDILKYQYFPKVAEIRSNGYDRLYNLIQYYSGSKFLSGRLGMSRKYGTNTGGGAIEGSWGHFSIVFAIRLCEFIRSRHIRASPPVRNPVIAIPNQATLQRSGVDGLWLHEKIIEFGGYENVARRLYLEY